MATIFDVAHRQTENGHRWSSSENLPASCAPQMDIDKTQAPDCSKQIPNGVTNGASADWVVQKFGGTSVAKYGLNIVDQVIRYCCQRGVNSHTEC